jgi:hypothetical protein
MTKDYETLYNVRHNKINPHVTKCTILFQFVSGHPALQTLDVRDPNLTPLELDSVVIHTPRKQDLAVHHTPRDQDSALIHTPPNQDSAVLHTTPEQDLLLGRSLADAASTVSNPIICDFLTDRP